MTTEAIRFGFLNEPLSVTWRGGTIKPLPNFEELRSCLEQSAGVYKGWVYPPMRAVLGPGAAEKHAWVPGCFALPPSHCLTLEPAIDPAHGDFFILLFGFLNGRRLQRDGWQHFYKTPIDRKLCDFLSNESSIEWALNKASDFCAQHGSKDEVMKLAWGALHWHTFAQLYEHEFERFDAQYKALDACYKLTLFTQSSFGKTNHATRAMRLCEHYGIKPPDWVVPIKSASGKESCELADRRNALAHEAMYGGQPLGFAHPPDQGAVELGLKALVSRILLSALGMRNEYTLSPSTCRQIFSFEIPA